MATYRITYSVYNGGFREYIRRNVSCFSTIFGGVNTKNTHVYLYPEIENIKTDIDRWVKSLNSIGFPMEITDENPDEIAGTRRIKIPIKEYNNPFQLGLALTYARYAYDQSGHCGKNLHTICDTFFLLKEKYPNEKEWDLLILASNLYGKGGGHVAHNNTWVGKIPFSHINYVGDWNNALTGFHAFFNERVTNTKNEEEFLFGKRINVYVVGGDYAYPRWIKNIILTKKLKNADLVMFTGGEDVSPKYYKEKQNPYTISNPARDRYEKLIFTLAKKYKKPMVGICRGSQFLCVMNGGKLVQHQQNPSYIHEIKLIDGDVINVTSTHHQAQFPFNLDPWEYKVSGWTKNISKFHFDGEMKELSPEKECEIVYYPNTKCLGIQSHPEHPAMIEDDKAMEILNKLIKKLIYEI